MCPSRRYLKCPTLENTLVSIVSKLLAYKLIINETA